MSVSKRSSCSPSKNDPRIVSHLLAHRLGLPLLGSPLWFLLPLRRWAHIPRERGGAPDGLMVHGWERVRMATVMVVGRMNEE